MSIQSSLLVLLLCFSLHESNARRLVATGRTDSAEKFLRPNKNNEKMTQAKTPVPTKLEPFLPKQTRVDDKHDDHMPMSPDANAKDMKIHRGVQEISSPRQPAVKPRLSESTPQLPYQIPLDQNQLVFNSDYATAQAHPPHNHHP